MKSNLRNWGRSLGVSTALSTAALFGSAASFAASGTPAPDAVNPQGDNSKMNAPVNGATQPTADQQPNATSDVEITRKIRRALTSDKSLSTYAQNVKIITQNGQVVLKGPVRSAKEKSTVESTATTVAGATKVNSELEVTPEK